MKKDLADPRSTATEPKDQIFAKPRRRIQDFDFGAETAGVFDDMLARSVPFYAEIQRMVGELTSDFAANGSRVYDLGCSTASTFLQAAQTIEPDRDLRFVGIDSSQEMLDIARKKLEAHEFPWPFELHCQDLNATSIENASVVLLVLTLQFVRPLQRQRLIRNIRAGLREDGCLIVVEKVLGETSNFNRLFIDHYYDFKRRNGYSDLEIAQKREALENVLIPYRFQENLSLLAEEGFGKADVFFKWYNFCGIIATK